MRQWSRCTRVCVFFPYAVQDCDYGARDRAATAGATWACTVVKKCRYGLLGLQSAVGGGMGRTPIIASTIREFCHGSNPLNYLRSHRSRHQPLWPSRRKHLQGTHQDSVVRLKASLFCDQVEAEYKDIVEIDGAPHTITLA
jgi:sulfite reductase (NADPH) hemoprotein beta-component